MPIAALAVGCSGDIDNLPTTPDPVIVTETFTGTLNINGGVTQNVFTGATGAVSATLTSLGDNPPAKVGFQHGHAGLLGRLHPGPGERQRRGEHVAGRHRFDAGRAACVCGSTTPAR